MPRQILGPAILVSLLAMLLLTARSDRARAADECGAGPVGTAPPGSHWYYRLDRVTHAHCWYLGPQGMRVAPGGTHAVPSAVRLPVARPTFLSGESAYASADAAATTPQPKPREGEAAPTFAMRWLSPSVSPGVLASAPASADETASTGTSLRGSYAAEPVAASETDRWPSAWPAREGADRQSALIRVARPFALMLAVLVTLLALVTLTERALFGRFTAHRGVSSTPRRRAQSMIPKSGYRSSEKIMLHRYNIERDDNSNISHPALVGSRRA